MILSKLLIERIKKIIEGNYRTLLVSVLGKSVLTASQLKVLTDQGFDVKNANSLLALIYYNNILNDGQDNTAPVTIAEMRQEQENLKPTLAQTVAEEHINQGFAQVVEKLSADAQTKVEASIRGINLSFRNTMIQNPSRPEDLLGLMKESSAAGIVKMVEETIAPSVSDDFKRIAITETSNALGLGSVDRVLDHNKDKDLKEVFIYRIPINDDSLCVFCKRFYLDSDGSPAVYRVATILNNGSNYGKKPIAWKPVAGATHPNERCSGVLELRPGWKVVAGGKVEFIGQKAWTEYLKKKIRT